MKNIDLIKCLLNYDMGLEVTTSDKKGIFNDVKDVELQEWQSGSDIHKSITLVIGLQDKSKTIVGKDEDFLDKVNECLEEGDKIDIDEALEAKKVFDNNN